MNEKIFLVDTNILQILAEAINIGSAENLQRWHKTALTFFDRHGQNIRIPSIVWGEFLGLWFHKNVDMNMYDKWFQNRLSCYAQTYKFLKCKKAAICDETGISYQKVMDMGIRFTSSQMPEGLILTIAKRLEDAITSLQAKCTYDPNDQKSKEDLQRNEKNRKQGKLLDGLDSIIVGFACEFARTNANRQVVLVTRDRFIIDFLCFFSRDKNLLLSYGMPGNVTASSPDRA